MRRTASILIAIMLLGAGCSASTAASKGPTTFRVGIDAPSPAGQNLQVSAFFPASLKVRAGDTVAFENFSSQAPHSVTFGILADRSNTPSLLVEGPNWNPAVFGPCYAASAPAATMNACPSAPPTQPPAYTGSGYWNSGLLVPAPAPEGPKTTTVTITDGTPAGRYAYVCVLHVLMTGTIEVVSPGEQRDAPAAVAKALTKQRDEALAQAAAITPPKPAGRAVIAGWSDRTTAVNRFEPAQIAIKAGETVTWRDASVFEPHTITFKPTFANEDPKLTIRAGGSSYGGGFSNSGLIGPKPFPAAAYALKFPKAGTYAYVCALHPGMAGTVIVA